MEFHRAERIYRKRPISRKIETELRKWADYWRKRSPVEFAEKILRIDPTTGASIQLSEGQKEFLEDMFKDKTRLAIIVAGRGAGKTFALAIYIAWRIYTHDYWWISSMGGSSEQSLKIQQYISGWRQHNIELERMTEKDVIGEIQTRLKSGVKFLACSATGTRGPHTRELIIDEQAAGEERGGERFIKAAVWQVSTSPNIRIIRSSTAHFIHGDFLRVWRNAEKLGYKRYRWSIARHKSGKPIDKVYTDKNPENWVSNVPWIPDENIRLLRSTRSDEEWLVEALGGISVGTGLVFNPWDLKLCICDRCEECRPYEEGYCPLVQYYMQLAGENPKNIPTSVTEALTRVGDRVCGVDWGRVAPTAIVILGKFKEFVFVLFAEELVGASDQYKINRIDELCKKWSVPIIRPDPREWSLNNQLLNRGYAVHELFGFKGGQEKIDYLYAMKRFIERHALIIPKAYEKLVESLKGLTYDKQGKIRKANDHSYDACSYAISYYSEMMEQEEFWEEIAKKKKRGVEKIW